MNFSQNYELELVLYLTFGAISHISANILIYMEYIQKHNLCCCYPANNFWIKWHH